MNIRSSKTAKADLVAAEASVWFIEFRTGDMTAGDRARFYEWLRRSPDHIQAYLEIAEGWAELPTSDPEHRLDIQALVARARESQDENVVSLSPRETALPNRQRRSMTAWAASLAGVALVLGLAVWSYLYQANTYRTGVGEQRTVRLLDGSTIELNALSSIRVRLSKNTREVDLREGQALFRVAKDPARPFLVHSDGTTVRAVGTQFDVYRKSTATVVTVLEGRVAVAEADSASGALDEGASGEFFHRYDKTSAAHVFVTLSKLGIMISRPESVDRFLKYPGVEKLATHPKLVAVKNDPVQSGSTV